MSEYILDDDKFYILSNIESMATLLRSERVKMLQKSEYISYSEESLELRLIERMRDYLDIIESEKGKNLSEA